jgi:hypothetical protein
VPGALGAWQNTENRQGVADEMIKATDAKIEQAESKATLPWRRFEIRAALQL